MYIPTIFKKYSQSFVSFRREPPMLILFPWIYDLLPVNSLEKVLIFFNLRSSFLFAILIPDLFLRRGGSKTAGLRSWLSLFILIS